jgi:hypothetical protein
MRVYRRPLGRPGFGLIAYISIAAVTAAGGFALTATYFFFKPVRVKVPVALLLQLLACCTPNFRAFRV